MTIDDATEVLEKGLSDTDVTLIILGAIVLIYLIINQRSRILEWLLYAVTNSEKDLGGGTGQLKLRMVYDWFVVKFPIISAIIPFVLFTVWVNKALKKMRSLKDNNIKVESYITGKELDVLKDEKKAAKIQESSKEEPTNANENSLQKQP